MSSVPSPWSRLDALRSALLIAVGAVLWLLGWHWVSGRPAMHDQIVPLNLAIVGLVLAGAGQAAWFLTGRRAVRRLRDALLGTSVKPALHSLAHAHRDLVAGGERFFHRLDCALLTGRHWSPQTRESQMAAGRVPCGVCTP